MKTQHFTYVVSTEFRESFTRFIGTLQILNMELRMSIEFLMNASCNWHMPSAREIFPRVSWQEQVTCHSEAQRRIKNEDSRRPGTVCCYRRIKKIPLANEFTKKVPCGIESSRGCCIFQSLSRNSPRFTEWYRGKKEWGAYLAEQKVYWFNAGELSRRKIMSRSWVGKQVISLRSMHY